MAYFSEYFESVHVGWLVVLIMAPIWLIVVRNINEDSQNVWAVLGRVYFVAVVLVIVLLLSGCSIPNSSIQSSVDGNIIGKGNIKQDINIGESSGYTDELIKLDEEEHTDEDKLKMLEEYMRKHAEAIVSEVTGGSTLNMVLFSFYYCENYFKRSQNVCEDLFDVREKLEDKHHINRKLLNEYINN